MFSYACEVHHTGDIPLYTSNKFVESNCDAGYSWPYGLTD